MIKKLKFNIKQTSFLHARPLEENRLISREVLSTRPPRIHYYLTKEGDLGFPSPNILHVRENVELVSREKTVALLLGTL